MRKISNQISDTAAEQLDWLANHFESQRVALEIAIQEAYRNHRRKKLRPWCGELADIGEAQLRQLPPSTSIFQYADEE